jgi:methionyl-tRNA formyltransferase
MMKLLNDVSELLCIDNKMIEHTVSNVESRSPSPRVVFFGMQGQFSASVLMKLLESDLDVCAVVLPAMPIPGRKPPVIQRREPSRAMRSMLPVAHTMQPVPLTQIAWMRHIPVWEVDRLAHPDTLATLAAYQPDVICVACFSRLIPRALINLPRAGCLNVHPSLLPANRGPVPLFWTFREGCDTTGVTIHFMEERMDHGDILAQEVIALHDGMSYDELEALCALRGGSLLASTVWALYEGRARSYPQDETQSSYHSFPEDADFVVQPGTWHARHVYNFIRGVKSWDRPVTILLGDKRFVVREAISYHVDNLADLRTMRQNLHTDREMFVPCRTGLVHVLLSSPAHVSA